MRRYCNTLAALVVIVSPLSANQQSDFIQAEASALRYHANHDLDASFVAPNAYLQRKDGGIEGLFVIERYLRSIDQGQLRTEFVIYDVCGYKVQNDLDAPQPDAKPFGFGRRILSHIDSLKFMAEISVGEAEIDSTSVYAARDICTMMMSGPFNLNERTMKDIRSAPHGTHGLGYATIPASKSRNVLYPVRKRAK